MILGSISVFIGASIGGTTAFLLGRYFFREMVVGWINPSTSEGPAGDEEIGIVPNSPKGRKSDSDGNFELPLDGEDGGGVSRTSSFGRISSSIVKPPTSTITLWYSLDKAMNIHGLKIMFLLRLSPVIPFNLLNYIAGTTGIKLKDYCLALLGILPGTILFVYIGASAKDVGSADGGMTKTIFLIVGAVFGFCGVAAVSYYAKMELNKIVKEEEGEKEEKEVDLLG